MLFNEKGQIMGQATFENVKNYKDKDRPFFVLFIGSKQLIYAKISKKSLSMRYVCDDSTLRYRYW